MFQVELRADTPSRFSGGDNKDPKTIGLLPTHGVPHGVSKDSSRSDKETPVLIKPLSVAAQLLLLRSSSNDSYNHLKS